MVRAVNETPKGYKSQNFEKNIHVPFIEGEVYTGETIGACCHLKWPPYPIFSLLISSLVTA
jgi:hypothetical protein